MKNKKIKSLIRNRTFRKVSSATTLLLMLFAYNQCELIMRPKSNKKSLGETSQINNESTYHSDNTNSDTGNEETTIPPEVEVVVKAKVQTGMKDYEQILETMSVLTGISSSNDNIQNVYEDIKTQLPEKNDIKTFMAAHQVGIVKLASEYCHRLVENQSARSLVWPGFNFGESAANAFSSVGRQNFINQTVNKFWGRSIASEFEVGMSSQLLNQLTNDLMAGENTGSNNLTRTIAKGICISVLASAPVMML